MQYRYSPNHWSLVEMLKLEANNTILELLSTVYYDTSIHGTVPGTVLNSIVISYEKSTT